jgi:membrane protein
LGSPARAEREGEDCGRSASTPSEIPARGWKDILLRIYKNIGEHRVIAIAAGVTFYVLLAIFPAVAALVFAANYRSFVGYQTDGT